LSHGSFCMPASKSFCTLDWMTSSDCYPMKELLPKCAKAPKIVLVEVKHMPSWLNGVGDKLLVWIGGGVVALLVLWRDVALLKGWRSVTEREIDDLKRKGDAQELRLAALDVTLGRIDENVKEILRNRKDV
jgi:hypothetical protein